VIENILKDSGFESIDIANFNSPMQTVISGPKEDVSRAAIVLEKKAGAKAFPLKVNSAFHSRYMKRVAGEFSEYLRQFNFTPLQIPVISNVRARPYRGDDIVENLTDQICSPVRWVDSIRYLITQGELEYEEIGPNEEMGPGRMLTKFVQATVSTHTRSAVPV
jgi:malonyl CoA-acyl carrier protein transacylase